MIARLWLLKVARQGASFGEFVKIFYKMTVRYFFYIDLLLARIGVREPIPNEIDLLTNVLLFM